MIPFLIGTKCGFTYPVFFITEHAKYILELGNLFFICLIAGNETMKSPKLQCL